MTKHQIHKPGDAAKKQKMHPDGIEATASYQHGSGMNEVRVVYRRSQRQGSRDRPAEFFVFCDQGKNIHFKLHFE